MCFRTGSWAARASNRNSTVYTYAIAASLLGCAVLLETAHGIVGQVVEPGVFAEELQLDRTGRAVTLLADDHFGQALVRRVFLVVVVVAVNEDDHVRVLLDGADFAQVRHDRALVGTRFQRAVELRQRDHRDVQFLRQALEGARDLGDFRRAVLAVARHLHQLQVVDDDQAQVVFALEAARLGAQHVRRQRGRVVDEYLGFAQQADSAGDAAPVLVLELAGAQARRVDAAAGRD